MRLHLKLVLSAFAVAALVAGGPALAQQKLKWAHVYETSEPYHKWSVWAAAGDREAHQRRFHIDVFPGLARSARNPTSTRG